MSSPVYLIVLLPLLVLFQVSDLFGQSVNIIKMVADNERPYVYAINSINDDEDTLLIISVESEQVIKAFAIGDRVTDMTIHYGEGRLYVTNWHWLHSSIQVVDLESQTLLPSFSLGPEVRKINAGRPGRLYYEEGSQWANIHIMDTETGNDVGSIGVREGDGEVDPTGNYYYHCDDNISNAHIHKYDILTDSPLEIANSLEHAYGSRNLILSGDGSRLFWRGYVYDSDLNELGRLGDEIYACSYQGYLAISSTSIYNTYSYDDIYTLPFEAKVMAFSGDQHKIYLYDQTTGELATIQTQDVPGISNSLTPVPRDGQTVSLPHEFLAWNILLTASGYNVYFGEDQDAVRAANTTSPEYLGAVIGNDVALERDLNYDRTYYWRLESYGLGEPMSSPVWRFVVAPVSVAPKTIIITAFKDIPPPNVSLTIESDVSRFWRVAQNVAWLVPDQPEGYTPSVVSFKVNTEGRSIGFYSDTLIICSECILLKIPVKMEIRDLPEMNIVRFVPDLKKPYVYALNGDINNPDESMLLFINTENGLVDRAVSLPGYATDADFDNTGDTLYVITFDNQSIIKVDVANALMTDTLSFYATGDHAQGQHYHLRLGRENRLYYIDAKWAPDLNVYDLATEETVSTFSFNGFGDFEITDDGNTIYSWRQYGWGAGSSNSGIEKIDCSTDDISVDETSDVDVFRDPLNTPVLLNSDESLVYCKTRAYSTADLSASVEFSGNIYAITNSGDIAFSNRSIFDGLTGDSISSLPVTSEVMTVSGDQSKIILYDNSSKSILVLRMDDLLNPTSAPDGEGLVPREFSLYQNYPNPFNPSTVVNYSLPKSSEVRLTIYSILGQTVRVLVDEFLPAGEFTVLWDGRNNGGTLVASGIYFYRLEADDYSNTKKMLLLK